MKIPKNLAVLFLLGVLALNACGPSSTPEPTSTPVDISAIQTQAASDFAFGLTATAFANPTATATQTPTPTFTPTPTGTSTGNSLSPLPGIGVQPTASCYSLGFVSDVTIPDNTPMTPGKAFTKTWRVKNNGTCAWEVGFKFAFVGGEQMGGATVSLNQAVSPGQETNISVDFIAPTNKTGALRSNWRMSTTAGSFFGDEVYVIITVGGSTATPTPTTASGGNTATPTSTPISTPTPTETTSP